MLLLFALVAGSMSSWAADVYERITSTSNLVAGEQYILVCETQGKVMGSISTTSTTYGTSVSATISSNTITATSDMNILTLGGNSDGWTFHTSKESKYLSWSSGKSLAVVSSGPNNSEKWTISFSSNNAVIANKGTDARKIVYNASSPRFACYTTTQTAIQIYKKSSSYTVTAQSNNATYGTVSIDGMKITGSPKEGCRYATPAYTVTSGTATVSQDGNTFTVTPSSDCTITINFEAIPAHTLSSAVSPAAAGTVTLGSTSVSEGSTTTATAAANAGYKFTGWSISGTGASLSSDTDNPTEVTMGTADATVTATFEAAVTHKISWSVNGAIVKTENVVEDAEINFSAPTSGIPNGYAFQGWVANKIDTPTDTDPSANYVTSATSTADVTYYAVMAIVKSSTPASWTEASLASLTSSDVFVIVGNNGDTYALPNGALSSGAPAAVAVTVSGSSLTTSPVADNLKWNLTKDTDGYIFYPNGTTERWLYLINDNKGVRVGDGDAKHFNLSAEYLSTEETTSQRYIGIYNSADWRCYTNTTANIAGQTFAFYKYVPSSIVYGGYCTSAKVSVTVSAVGFATLFTPAALDFSGVDGLTAYTAVKDGDVVRLTQVNDVPANTGVVLEGAAGTYSIPAIATSSTAKGELTGNATEATAWNAESGYTYYVLAASTGSGVEFRPVSEGEIAAGKAFLKVATGGTVHAFNVVFGDETGISEVVRGGEKGSAIFDLSGRRVAKPTKGLYIVNGKKILVK